jgi:LytTr DNA-binding domain
MISFFVLLGFISGFSQNSTIELPKMANKVINNFTQVAIAKSYNKDNKIIKNLKFLSFQDFSKKFKTFPLETKSTWVKFQLKNNFTKDTVFYLKSPFIPNLELFCKENNHLISLGCTGTNCNYKALSVKNDEARIEIKLKKKETKLFYLQSKSLFYSNAVPSITIENYITRFEKPTVNQISENQIYVSLSYFFIGINIVFMVLAMFRYVTIKKDPAYLVFVLLNFVITLYNLSTYRIIIFEFDFLPEISNNEFSNYFADFMLLFYFLFFLSFLKLPKKSFIKKLLIFGCLYYCLQIVIECSDFSSTFLINFSLNFLKTTPEFNILSYSIVFIYLTFYTKSEYYFAKYGLFSILIGTTLIALSIMQSGLKIKIDPIDNMFITFLVYQISNLFDFVFFFYSLILIEKNITTQNDSLQTEIQNNKKELETTKKLIENEHIILKDKTKIELKKLIYIKADDHYLNIFSTENKKPHLVRGKLSEITLELPANFIKCHRSFIVNKNEIKKIQSTTILMNDNTEIPISRGFKM